jgi:uncharacterized Ntn-hydrolase superfamily protein
MTFAIVARTADALLFGVAIASSSPAVAARCAHARARVGAVATQNITDPSLGPAVLDALARGADPRRALDESLRATEFAAYRQLLVIGPEGPPVVHSGSHALGIVGAQVGAHSAAAGNLLASADIPAVMTSAFESCAGHLGDRLLLAMRAAVERGGEAGPIHSAGLLIVRELSWPIVDLRVDWTDADPVARLESIWSIYKPQIDDYVRRALDPQAAPGFGVPGDMK